MDIKKGRQLLLIATVIIVSLSVGTSVITALIWFIRGDTAIAISNLITGSTRLFLHA